MDLLTTDNVNDDQSYHSEEELPDDYGVGTFILALVIGIVSRNILTRKIKLPYTVIILAFGLIIGFFIHEDKHAFGEELGTSLFRWINIKPEVILYALLPVLIFESSFSTDFHTFIREIWQVLVLAGPGVLIVTFLTGTLAKYIFNYNWDWDVCLMFGAMLSATDPVAVVAILKELGVSERLGTLIEGESLLNDGTAIVVFNIFHSSLLEGTKIVATDIIKDGLRLSLGGPLVGILVGYFSAWTIGFIFNDPIAEITLSIVCCYVSFLIAEGTEVEVSGILSVVFSGLIFSFYGNGRISSVSEHFLHSFWKIMGYLANTLIFFVSGLIMADKALAGDNIGSSDWGYLIILYICCQIIRVINVIICYPILKRGGYGISFEQLIVLAWSGLRGAVGLTLALIVAETGDENQGKLDRPTRDRILFHMAGIAMLTLMINGTTSGLLIHYLELDRSSRASTELFIHTCSVLENKLEEVMHMLKLDRFLADADWETVWRYIPIYTSRVYWHRIRKKHIRLSDLEHDHILTNGEIMNVTESHPILKYIAKNKLIYNAAIKTYTNLPPRLRQTWLRHHLTFHVDNFEEISELLEGNKLIQDIKPQSLFDVPLSARDTSSQVKDFNIDALSPRPQSMKRPSATTNRRPSNQRRFSNNRGSLTDRRPTNQIPRKEFYRSHGSMNQDVELKPLVIHGHNKTLNLKTRKSKDNDSIPIITSNNPLTPVASHKPFSKKPLLSNNDSENSNNINDNKNNINNNNNIENSNKKFPIINKLPLDQLNNNKFNDSGVSMNFVSDHDSDTTYTSDTDIDSDNDSDDSNMTYGSQGSVQYQKYRHFRDTLGASSMMAPLMTEKEMNENPTAMLMTCLTVENEKDLRYLVKTRGGSYATESSMIKEARVRFLMAIKAKYRSNHKRGWLSATGLRVLIENVDVQLDNDGEQLHDWDHLASNYSIPANLMSKLSRLRNYPILNIFVESYIHRKLSFVFELASNFIYAHDEVDILEFLDEGEVANKIASEHLEQLNKARKTLREQLPVFPEIARALKTQVATRFMLVKHREITEELMTHGILTEKESEFMMHENIKAIIKLNDHPYSEHLPPREQLLAKTSFLRYLDDKTRAKIVNDERLCQEEFHGSNIILMRNGENELASDLRKGQRGFYIIIRGTVLSGIDNTNDYQYDDVHEDVYEAAQYLNAGQMFGFTSQVLDHPFLSTYLTASFVHLFYFDTDELIKSSENNLLLKKSIWWTIAMDIAQKINAFRKISKKVMEKLMSDAKFVEVSNQVFRSSQKHRSSLSENNKSDTIVSLLKKSTGVLKSRSRNLDELSSENSTNSPNNQDNINNKEHQRRESLAYAIQTSKFNEDEEDRLILTRNNSLNFDETKEDTKILILNTNDRTIHSKDAKDINSDSNDDYDNIFDLDEEKEDLEWQCEIDKKNQKRKWVRKDSLDGLSTRSSSPTKKPRELTECDQCIEIDPTVEIKIEHGNQILILKGALRYRPQGVFPELTACSAPALIKHVFGPVNFTPGSKLFIIPAVMIARDNSAHQMLMHSINRRTLLSDIKKEKAYGSQYFNPGMRKNLSRFLKSQRDLHMANKSFENITSNTERNRAKSRFAPNHQESFIGHRYGAHEGRNFFKLKHHQSDGEDDNDKDDNDKDDHHRDQRSKSIDELERNSIILKDHRRSMSETRLMGSMTNILSGIFTKTQKNDEEKNYDADDDMSPLRKTKFPSFKLLQRKSKNSLSGVELKKINEEQEEGDNEDEKKDINTDDINVEIVKDIYNL